MIQAPHTDDAQRVGPLDKPAVYYSPREHSWLLAEDFTRQIDGRQWFIAAGFHFDLSSVPRILWPLLASYELGVLAPLCHDYLYRHGGVAPSDPPGWYDRYLTDLQFLRHMTQEGVSAFRRYAAFLAVRLFGAFAWQDTPPAAEPQLVAA